MGDEELRTLLESSAESAGWGRHQTVEMDEGVAFVKRVPVTDLEMENEFSTSNLYDLPLFYNYGVGSAGFGVFRELATHVKTTKWVLEGSILNFPLMYHYRIMPFSGPRAEVPPDRVAGYVKYWGSNESVGRYWSDRVDASHELVIFLEHFPHVLDRWLIENQDRLPDTLTELRTTIDFLRREGVIHFDAHYANVVTDGTRPYLTDFGLALDRSFALTQEEAAFFDDHSHYDYGEVLWNAGYLISAIFNTLSDDDKRDVRVNIGMGEAGPLADPFIPLVDNIEKLANDPRLNLHPDYVAAVVRYRGSMTLVQDFFVALRANLRKDTAFPHEELKRLLKETGFAD